MWGSKNEKKTKLNLTEIKKNIKIDYKFNCKNNKTLRYFIYAKKHHSSNCLLLFCLNCFKVSFRTLLEDNNSALYKNYCK